MLGIRELLDDRGLEVFDAHAHVGRYPYLDIPGNNTWDVDDTVRNLQVNMEEHGVRRAVVSSFEGLCYNWPHANRALLGLQHAHADVFYAFVSVHPHSEQAASHLREAASAGGACGLKLHPTIQRFDPLCREVQELMELCEELAVPVLFHSGTKHWESSPDALSRLAEAHPRVTFIFAHMGGASPHRMAERVRKLENVYLETSTAGVAFDSLRRVVKTIGAERVLYGSDFPCSSMAMELWRVLCAGLSAQDLGNVLCHNALRLLRKRHPRTASSDERP